jgi:hypothetical protein
MTYVIRVAKQGFSVTDLNTNIIQKSKRPILPHVFSTFALPYLLGAKNQIIRYRAAASILERDSINGIFSCLHETSTLFEDLSTVAKYIEKFGYQNKIHELWFDIRNHIRHDIREEFDNDSHKRKNERASRLKLDSRLQTDIGFAIDSINIGKTVIKVTQINYYLQWAEKIIRETLDEAKKNGHINNN